MGLICSSSHGHYDMILRKQVEVIKCAASLPRVIMQLLAQSLNDV
jgi:hypothetical protein